MQFGQVGPGWQLIQGQPIHKTHLLKPKPKPKPNLKFNLYMNMPKLQPLWPTILWEFLVIIVTKHVFVFVVFPWKIFIFYDLLAVVNLMDNSLLSCADNSCKKQVICQRWNMYMLLTFALLIYFGAVLDYPCPCNFHQPKKEGERKRKL